MTDFLSRLRTKTAAQHHALEQNPLSVALMQPDLQYVHYRIYLEALYGIVKIFEDNMFHRLQPYFDDLEQRRKTGLLLLDLEPQRVPALPLVPASRIKALYKNDYACCGGLYVLEGSTLGGTLIYKHAIKILGSAIDNKTNYFNAYGSHTGSRWKQFLINLQSIAVTPAIEADIIEGARNTFSLFDNWFLEY